MIEAVIEFNPVGYMEAFHYIAMGIGISGSFVIAWGVMYALFLFFKTEYKKLSGHEVISNEEKTRSQLSSYLLLGLDFMLAADIIHTIHNSTVNELYALGMIVIIRTVMSYFLNKELLQCNYDKRKQTG